MKNYDTVKTLARANKRIVKLTAERDTIKRMHEEQRLLHAREMRAYEARITHLSDSLNELRVQEPGEAAMVALRAEYAGKLQYAVGMKAQAIAQLKEVLELLEGVPEHSEPRLAHDWRCPNCKTEVGVVDSGGTVTCGNGHVSH